MRTPATLSLIILNTQHSDNQPAEYPPSRVADAHLPGEVGLPLPGDGQEVGGGSEGGTASLLPLPTRRLGAQITCTTAASAVQQILQMEVAGGDEVGGGGVEGGELEDGVEVIPASGAGDGGPEGLPVLDTHDVVEERVEGGGEIVETAGGVEQDLVHCAEHLQLLEVNITQPLEMERSPGDEEQDHNRNWKESGLLEETVR